MKENLKENLGIDVESQNLQEKNLEVELDGNTFEITKEGEVKDKGIVTPPPAGDEVTPGVIVEGSNKKYTDKNGKDTAVIPVGFAVSEKADEQVIEEGLVIKDADGNEFVWIPVASADVYKATTTYANTSVSAALTPDEGYLPTFNEGEKVPDGSTEAEKEKNLVTTNMIEKYGVGGFYISRYEAGDGSATVEEKERTIDSDTTGELVSKKDAYVYNWIYQTDAKEKAKEFTGADNANVKSGLCTGIQWDMVMSFVDGKKDGKGNDYNVIQASDDETTSDRHTGSLANSGQNEADRVCNIYDLEGNCIEYVAEKNTCTSEGTCNQRGGFYNWSVSASYRSGVSNSGSSSYSFRFVLYVM